MSNTEFYVGIKYTSDAVDELGIPKSRAVYDELSEIQSQFRNGSVARGTMKCLDMHEGFDFFCLDDAVAFMHATAEKPYVKFEILISHDRYRCLHRAYMQKWYAERDKQPKE